ncbi:hypothetical protein F4779DRAFT_331916 [Xylariaceae sp. FL0662B]|nr:hypothetical protein F4779DRAFT_331916 [Xylariaceae sp. FL0662B]
MAADIAIIGVSFKGPQDAENESGLWNTLKNCKNVMTEWPESRVNLDPFYDVESSSPNKLHSRGANFLKQEPAVFDAPFFSITAKEAAVMDPQHRLTLEASYRAFENAGMPVEGLRGTRTGVFAASTSDDYHRMTIKDPESTSPTMTGSALSLLANRVSWHFDLLGPSIHIDTACSSSLTALDMACQSLRSGDSSMALVAGANMILGPENSVILSNGNYLSPDSVCYSFDHRANGYARGEGIVVVIIKPLPDAVRDNDMIRAVIRSTGSNQDGRTPIMTQPSTDSQEQLIRHVYEKAGLGFESTRFFEAHGTGTAVGDPAEMKAIGRVFRSYRSSKEPLYVGSVKSNIGHLEASSGLAGVVKAMLILEKGIVPPNALFEEMNPDIDAGFYHLAVPTKCITWPGEGLRRISVNSFGFGGSNTHVVMDDAFHYLKGRGLKGNHCTNPFPFALAKNQLTTNGELSIVPSELCAGPTHCATGVNGVKEKDETNRTRHESRVDENGGISQRMGFARAPGDEINGVALGVSHSDSSFLILVLTAADEKTLGDLVRAYEAYCGSKIGNSRPDVDQLAFTLAARRSLMLWRTFAVVNANAAKDAQGHDLSIDARWLSTAKPTRALADPSIAFVFTGQGAQYANMGLQLLKYPIFEGTLQKVDDIFHSQGCSWSVFGENYSNPNQKGNSICRGLTWTIDELGRSDNIDRPEYSQPLSTALQIALVELLKSFGVVPSAVVGHSSGEIAAAYTVGGLSLSSACKVAYYRGQLAGKLKTTADIPGAMLSANLSAHQVQDYLTLISSSQLVKQVHVACINSPSNSTLSGPEEAIDIIKRELNKDGIFSKKITTGVPYHSPFMQSIAAKYKELIGSLEAGDCDTFAAVPMVSSVSGQPILSPMSLTTAQYWVDNLVSPVKFSDALRTLTNGQLKIGASSISHLIEVGPHPALRRPIEDTLSRTANKTRQIRYSHVLHKAKPAHQAMLGFLGQLFCDGYPVSITAANQQSDGKETLPFRVDCPEYPFNHSRAYWREPRLSRDSRLRGTAPGDSLGARFHDWNPLEPKWRKFLSVDSTPWTKDHLVMGTFLYPGTGMIVMALEAVKQICPENRPLTGYYIKEAHFINPIVVGETSDDSTETIVQLRRLQSPYEKESTWSEVKIMTQSKDRWTVCFQARIQTQYAEDGVTQVDGGLERRLWDDDITNKLEQATKSCTRALDHQAFYKYCDKAGIVYGKAFRLLHDISWDGDALAIAKVDVTAAVHQSPSLTHPAILDCALQVLMAQASKGLSESLPTFVPNHIFNTWIGASGWQPPETSYVRILTERATVSNGQGLEAAVHVLDDSGSPLCAVEKLVMAPVSEKQEDGVNETKLLYGIEWKPQLSMMGRQELHQTCNAGSFAENDAAMANFRRALDPTLDEVLRRTVEELSNADQQRIPDALQKHVRWMKHHIAHVSAPEKGSEAITDQSLEVLLQELEELYPPWGIFPAIARNLKPILLGQIDPLYIAFGTGLAEMFYADIFSTICNNNFRTLLSLLSHENPTMRILEVGAGTGGMTSHILSTLCELEKCCGGTKFSEYVYTDVSPSFFESARGRFQEHEARMTFKTFDLDRGGTDQGFDEGTFDVVVAGCVLHATRDLKSTIQNLHAMLKPGGHIIYLEVVVPENITTNFAFGLLPGWWSSIEDYRSLSPTITEQQWDQTLRENGFSGNELVLRDYDSKDYHTFSIMLSTRCESSASDTPPPGRLLLLVQGQADHKALGLAESIRERLNYRKTIVLSLDEIGNFSMTEDDLVISLLEVGAPFLATISDAEYQILKNIIQHMRKLLWITSVSLSDARYPAFGIMQGFLRSIRSENVDKQIVTLAIETDSQEGAHTTNVEHVAKVVLSAFESHSDEVEYRARDGQLLTARIFQEKSLNKKLHSLVFPQLEQQPWKSGPPVKLSVHTPGFLDTLEFIEDGAYGKDLGPYEVEIEPRAWALNFRDVFVALGRLPEDGLGYDCAGVVTRVGSSCDTTMIQPGDRVCGGAIGCMRTYPRAPVSNFVKIHDTLSFEAAASSITPTITAYYSLIEVARLRKGEKILIHSAAGATGQMAVRIASMIGAEIFVTVGFDKKKQFLVDNFDIPADHIFYSRNTTFARGIMRVTKGHGVDVVLNSLSGDGLRASWECVAPYGRFIEIGKADIDANSALPMACFARNASFSAVDLYYVAKSNPELVNGLLEKVMNLITNGVIRHPSPLHIYSTSNIEKAFRYLQSGKSMGRIIISVADSVVTPKRLLGQSTWKLDPNASYVVVGASGGLGRAISKWMADRGAKHLILLSRSGATTSVAAKVIAELQEQGVDVMTPKCDVSSEASLSAILQQCAAMPPVKGCINSAMVLHDTIFDNMTHTQWEATIRSKVQTSWNLHKLLPRSLDFFVLLSSLSGIHGSISQSNYSAGCAYQDALARYRVAHGQKAVSFDLGWMHNIGIVAEIVDYQKTRESAADMMPIEDTELLALLDIFCDPNSHEVVPVTQSQLLVGTVTPADCLSRGVAPPTHTLRPMFAGFSLVVGKDDRARVGDGALNFAALFRQASGSGERAYVVVQGLATKLARAMSIAVEDIEPSKQLFDYGVDSLMAIELRNWIAKDFGANVAVFEIMGGTTIANIGSLVVEKSDVAKER